MPQGKYPVARETFWWNETRLAESVADFLLVSGLIVAFGCKGWRVRGAADLRE